MLHEDSLKKTDPEFMERWKAFACDEVVNEPDQQLDDPTRYLAIMAALTGSQSIDAFKAMLPEAMEGGLTPVMLKEMVYQAVDYLGFGRVSQRAGCGASSGKSGNDNHGRSSGKRRPGPGRYFWRRYERFLEERPYQPLAFCQLFRRLLHKNRSGL